MRPCILRTACLVVGLAAAPSALPQSQPEPLVGFWRASDGDGRMASIIEIFPEGDQLAGRIAKTVAPDGQEVDVVCAECPGELRGKSIKGMTFLRKLRKSGDRWVGGEVINLQPGFLQGTVASCNLSLVDGQAEIEGWMGVRFLGRRNRWVRVSAP